MFNGRQLKFLLVLKLQDKDSYYIKKKFKLHLHRFSAGISAFILINQQCNVFHSYIQNIKNVTSMLNFFVMRFIITNPTIMVTVKLCMILKWHFWDFFYISQYIYSADMHFLITASKNQFKASMLYTII